MMLITIIITVRANENFDFPVVKFTIKYRYVSALKIIILTLYNINTMQIIPDVTTLLKEDCHDNEQWAEGSSQASAYNVLVRKIAGTYVN